MKRISMVLVLLSIGLVGCGGDDGGGSTDGTAADTATTETTEAAAPAEPFAFDVTSVDFGYELGTAEVPAGPVLVTQTNEGGEPHQVTLIRLGDGQTPAALTELIATEGDGALDPAAFSGGPNAVPGGEVNTAQVELAAGEYVAYCFLPNHAAQGMVEPFTVTGEPPSAVAEVEVDSTVSLADFGFVTPEGWDGQGTVEVRNDGPQVHELTINTVDNVAAGGLTSIAPGETGYIDLALAPGDYTLICFVQDPESGQPHFALGMQRNITIP